MAGHRSAGEGFRFARVQTHFVTLNPRCGLDVVVGQLIEERDRDVS
jgi:hypothetical protein